MIVVIVLFVPMARASHKANTQLSLREKLRRMDIVGTIVFLGAIVCLLLALTWGGQMYAWNNSRVIGLLVGFGVLTICLSYWIWRQGETAFISLRILRKRSIATGAVTLFGFGLGMNLVRVPRLHSARWENGPANPKETHFSTGTTCLYSFKPPRTSALQ